ncbi:MAG: DUF2206 domain-containing protein [Halobacteriota archaeon]
MNKIEFLKKFVLSVGLSITFLMFVGLFLNQLYLAIGISKPLSTSSLVVSFTVILVILAVIAYKRNKEDLYLPDVSNIRSDLKKDHFISPLLFPIIFPFLSVFGTYLMNTEGNNIILLIMFFLIPIYIALVVLIPKLKLGVSIPKSTYPVAILMIGIALLLSHGLTSHYLIGSDIHGEYYHLRLVADNLHWSIVAGAGSTFSACLSVSLLSPIYKLLLGMNGLYVYKLLYQLLFSITPLACYLLFKKHINESYAFLASCFFMAQGVFIHSMPSCLRQEIGVLFFALAMMILFDDEMDKLNKRMLFLLFAFSVVVSYYTSAYVLFIFAFLPGLMTKLIKNFKSQLTLTMSLLIFVTIFFWYGQVTVEPFSGHMGFIESTLQHLANFFIEESRDESAYLIVGKGAETLSLKISVIVHDITFALIAIGVFTMIRRYKEMNFDREYLLLTLISCGLLVLMVALPYVSEGYSLCRLYIHTLVILAPAFVIGGHTLAKYIRCPALLVILIVLSSQCICVTHTIDEVLGDYQTSFVDLNREEGAYSEKYIYDQEVICARWLNEHSANNLKIYSDYISSSRLRSGYEVHKKPNIRNNFFTQNKTIKEGYIYLNHANVVNERVYLSEKGIKNITEYSHLFVGKSKIYDNGGSRMWR